MKTPEEYLMALLTVKELEADSKISRHTWRAWIAFVLVDRDKADSG